MKTLKPLVPAALAALCLHACTKSFPLGAGSRPSTVTLLENWGTGTIKGQTLEIAAADVASLEVSLTSEPLLEEVRRQTQRQLQFMIGALESHNLSPNFNEPARVTKVEAMPDGSVVATYDVTFDLFPTNGDEIVDGAVAGVTLPKRIDPTARQLLLRALAPACHRLSLDPASMSTDQVASAANEFFYHFVPMLRGCDELVTPLVANGTLVAAHVAVSRRSNASNTRSMPEYDLMWQDGELRAVILLSPSREDWDDVDDPTVASFNMLFHKFKRRYPQAVWEFGDAGDHDLPQGTRVPAPEFKAMRMTAKLDGARTLIVDVLLTPRQTLGSTSAASIAVKRKFAALSSRADLISYSGHSDYGENVAQLNEWSRFEPGRHYLYFLNSCWSMGYLTHSTQGTGRDLVKRVAELNAGSQVSRHLDFIVNSASSDMYKASSNLMSLVDALAETGSTYAEIISRFTQDGAPVVINDEDNPQRP